MSTGRNRPPRDPAEPRGSAYEPPRVERVLTPADLEAEILYAGSAAAIASPDT